MDLKTKRAGKRIATPENVYTMSIGTNPEFDTPRYRYNYSSMITPNSTYEYNFKTGKSELSQTAGNSDRLRQNEIRNERVSGRLRATA